MSLESNVKSDRESIILSDNCSSSLFGLETALGFRQVLRNRIFYRQDTLPFLSLCWQCQSTEEIHEYENINCR